MRGCSGGGLRRASWHGTHDDLGVRDILGNGRQFEPDRRGQRGIGERAARAICLPDARRCEGGDLGGGIEVCASTGLEWVLADDCGAYGACEFCVSEDDCDAVRCASPCDVEGRVPSSEGCSFFATRLLEGDNSNGTRVHSVIVANPDPSSEIGRASCRERV